MQLLLHLFLMQACGSWASHPTAVDQLSSALEASKLAHNTHSLMALYYLRSLAHEECMQGRYVAAVQHLTEALPMCDRQPAAASHQRALELLVIKVGLMLELADVLAARDATDEAKSWECHFG